MQFGLTVGTLALPLLAWALVTFGWRPVTIASGLIVLAVGLPLSRLLHSDPELLGLGPDGDAPIDDGRTAQSAAPRSGRSVMGDILRTRAFWSISVGHAAAMTAMGGVNVHFVIYANEVLGLSITTAAAIVSVMTVAAIVGQVAGGAFGDRIEKRLLASGGMLLHAAAMALLVVATDGLAVLVAAVLHGFAWGLRGPLMCAMRADYFGRAAFASVMGFSSLVVMIGSVSGPLIIGFVTDTTGSYAGGFAAIAGIALGGAVAFLAAGAPPRNG
jgi:sugar phosphate permease